MNGIDGRPLAGDARDERPLEGRTMRPMLDPARDLAGATPETLAKALFRRVEPLRPARVGKSVVRNEASVEKVAADEPGGSIPHLGKSS